MIKSYCDKCEYELFSKGDEGGWEDTKGNSRCGKCATKEGYYDKEETRKIELPAIEPTKMDKVPKGARN